MAPKKPPADSAIGDLVSKLFNVCSQELPLPQVLGELPTLLADLDALAALQDKRAPKDEPAKRPDAGPKELEALRAWLKKQGATGIDDIEFADLGNGMHGVRAKRDVEAGETVLTVPHKAMLTNGLEALDKRLESIVRRIPILSRMPNFLLPLRILLESYAPDSSYATYLACLPRSYSIPLFWSFEHFEMLKGSMTLASAVKDLKVFVRAYCTIYNGLAQPSKEAMPLSAEQFTWRSWKFAMGATITRQNNYTIQVEPETRVGLALIPGLDMFNHTSGSAPGADYEFGNKRAEVRSADSAKAGDEIRIVYGNRTNPKLLLYSGFIDEALPLSSIDLGVAIPTDKSSLGRSRAGLMASVGFPRDRPIALELEPPYPEASEALWVFVRLLLADEKGLDLLRDAIRHEPNLITIPGVIGEAVEKKIWDWMKVRCMVTLRGMAGTDDDVKERDALPQGSLKRAILHLRISERKFLAEAIEALGQFPEGKFAGKEHVCDGNHPQERSEHDHDHDGEPCGGHGGKGGHSHSHSHDGKSGHSHSH